VTVRGWSLLAAGLVLAAWLAAGALQWWQYSQTMSEQVRFLTTWVPATSHASRLELIQSNTIAALDRAVLHGQVDRPERLEVLLVQMGQSTARLRSLLAKETTLRGLLEGADSSQQEWLRKILDPSLEAMARGRTESAASISASQTNELLTRDMQQGSALLHAQVQIRSLQQSRELGAAARSFSSTLVIAMALILTTIIGVGIAMRAQILRPIRRLRAAVRQAATDPSRSSPISTVGPQEIASVARDAEGLRRQLVEEILDARAANEALGTHAPLVAEVRNRLHGQPAPELREMEVFASTRPASGVIGGDWWQFVQRAGGIWCLVLADVSGHGWQSGVTALQMRAVLDTLLCSDLPLRSIPLAAGHLLTSGEHTVSMVLVELDTTGNEVRYLNAGHPPPLLLRPDQANDRAQWHELTCTGPVLSCLPAATTSWTCGTLSWHPGDALIAYSDGFMLDGISIWTGGADWLHLVATRFGTDSGSDMRHRASGLLPAEGARRLTVEGADPLSTGESDDASLIVITRKLPVSTRR